MKSALIGAIFALATALVPATITAPVLAQVTPESPEALQEDLYFTAVLLDACLDKSEGYDPSVIAYCLCAVEEIAEYAAEYASVDYQVDLHSEPVRAFALETGQRCAASVRTLFPEFEVETEEAVAAN